MLTEIFLKTTAPGMKLSELLSFPLINQIILSVIFHTIIYIAILNIGSYTFFGKALSKTINIRLIVILFLIMFFGYIARWIHVKDVYKAYNYDMEKTRTHLDSLYIGWIFIA